LERKGRVFTSTERLQMLEQDIALRNITMENFKTKVREQNLIASKRNEMVMDDIKLLVNDSLGLRFELDEVTKKLSMLQLERKVLTDEISSLKFTSEGSEIRCKMIEEENLKFITDIEKLREQNLKAEGEKETLTIMNKSLEEENVLVNNSLSLRFELNEVTKKLSISQAERKKLTDEISSLQPTTGESEIRFKMMEEEKSKYVIDTDILLAELREQCLKAEKEILMIRNESFDRENARHVPDIDSLRATPRERVESNEPGESLFLEETLAMDKVINFQENTYLSKKGEEILQGIDRSQRLELDILIYNQNVLSPQEGRSKEHKDLISNTDREMLMMDSFLSSDIFFR
jgi:chorismate mutase